MIVDALHKLSVYMVYCMYSEIIRPGNGYFYLGGCPAMFLAKEPGISDIVKCPR
jgi:hypothetical protein